MSEDKIRAYYDEARALFPLLPRWYEYVTDGVTPECRGLNAAGLAILSVPEGYTLKPSEGYHECGHVYLALLKRAHPERDFLTEYWTHRGFPGSVQDAFERSARDSSQNGSWMTDPRESWAEAFANAVAGVWVGEKTLDYGKTIAPLKTRDFFQSLVATVSAPIQNTQPTGGPKVIAAIPPLDPPSVVVDYYSPKGADFMRCLRENGVSGIARYLTNDAHDIRQTTRAEVAAAHAAGLSVHFFYEVNPPNPPASLFTYAKGGEDCRQAIDRLRELGAPEGTVVYFCIDNDIEPSAADDYFNAVEWNLTPQIVPGVYGFERMAQYARQYYPNVGKHVWQTYGIKRGPLDAWQHNQDALCGVSVDFNECAADGWRAPKEVEVTDEEFIDKTRRLITPTLDAMKTAYDPLIVAARANGLIDATQEAHLAALDTRLAKLREV